MEIILLVARHTNVEQTRALHCLCKDILHSCRALDIWLVKFTEEFPSRPFHPWWTAEENYILQKKYRTRMCLWVNESAIDDVDSIIYKYTIKANRLIDAHSDYMNHGAGYDAYKQVRIDLTKKGEYAILRRLHFRWLHFASDDHRKDIISFLEEDSAENLRSYGLKYCIVKLSDLALEFRLSEDTLEERIIRNNFWFFDPEEDELDKLHHILAL